MLSEKIGTSIVSENTTAEKQEVWTGSLDFVRSKALREEIKKYVSNPEHFLGKGGAAMVFSFEGQCVKLMKNRHNSASAGMFKLGNTAEKEFEIQGMLDEFEVDGVYSPMTGICYTGQENTAIVMEELNAVNLQLVINGEKSLPANFNADDFCLKLETYIYEMHDFGIAHGDLFARNVMIDNETGNPRVIDFGKAMYSKNQKDSNFVNMTKEDVKNLNNILLTIENKL